MARPAHRIGRLVFDLDAAQAEEIGQLSAHLEGGGAELVAAALAPVLDRLAGDDAVIRIDRLELDLGRIDPDGGDLAARLAEAAADALTRALNGAEVAVSNTRGADERPDGSAVTRPEALLAQFLITGLLPAPLNGAALAALCEALLAQSRSEFARAAPEIWRALASPAGRWRAVAQLPAPLVLRLLAARATGFAPIEPDGTHPLPDRPAQDALAPLLRAALAAAHSGDVTPAMAVELRTALAAAQAKPSEEGGRADEDQPPTDDEIPAPASADPAAEAAAQGIPCPVSGLVLLAPFLAPFLEAVGLFRNGAIQSPEDRIRAVLLTQFLATGTGATPEPDLALAKLLCGLPKGHPAPYVLDFLPEEEAEAGRLLEAVIAHWGALGATTPEGLRDGFLRRPGVLDLSGDGPSRLRVERRGIDMLLDRLPWTLSRVQTPFMAAPLLVDWR